MPIRLPYNMTSRGGGGEDSDDDESGEDLLEQGRRRARSVVDGFVDFAFQGNVLEIAFGLM